jgi:enamine deaminase RidA (YjgF/YER057c/UK114 family)
MTGWPPSGGYLVFRATRDLQLRQTMRNLFDNLEEAGLTFEDVVSTNVYLDDLSEFNVMNRLYAKYFTGTPPARTTIQQVAPVDQSKSANETYPTLEQISLIAVKRKTK